MESPRIELKPKTKNILQEWLFIIVSMTLLMYAYYFIVWWGMEDYLGSHAFEAYFDSGFGMLEILIQGILFGVMFGMINLLVDNKLRSKSFGAIILIKTILYTLAAGLSQLAVYYFYHAFNLVPKELLDGMRGHISIKFMISMTLYFIGVIVIINFLLQINRKFGYGVLLSMITGKYNKPRKERRIFMFIDMKDSTANAERLGHVKYSRLIQSCIIDMTDLIIRYKAQVYQYVGDEIVLTWPTKKGLQEVNCINLFFAYQQKLNDRRSYYEDNFGTVPIFKAGIDEGIVTVTEVGEIKRELAYHGEILHTAARLEKLCNQLKKSLLVTQTIHKNIHMNGDYKSEIMGDFQLRGKEQKEKVFGINRKFPD